MSKPGQGTDASRVARVEESPVGLLDYAAVIWRHWWLVLGVCVVTIAVTWVVTLRMPKIYAATATVIAPREGGSPLTGLAGLVQQQGSSLSMPSLTPNRDLLLSILRSRSIARTIIERYGLQQRYSMTNQEDVVDRLRGVTEISMSREGVISVKVEGTDPAFAAELANAYVEHLDRSVTEYGIGEAGQQRRFLTEQLARAKAQLQVAEDALRGFQQRHPTAVMREQAFAEIETEARLRREITAAEVQLQVMRSFATETNPEVVALRHRLDELRRQIAKMRYGDGAQDRRTAAQKRERGDFTLPFSKAPAVGLELTQLTRTVRVEETLMTLLTQQLEQTKLAEARDLPTVRVLDRAVPPVRHSRPRLRNNLMLAGVLSLLGGVVLAFTLDHTMGRRRAT